MSFGRNKKLMKLLFLGMAIPDMNTTQNLYTELLEEFKKNGHEILVVAPAHVQMSPGIHIENGIKVLRIKTLNQYGVNRFRKGLANVLLPYQYKWGLKKYKISLNFDLIIIPTPPITLLGVTSWVKKKANAKVYLILRDIFPQNAVDLKLIKKDGIFHRYFRKKERQLYRISDAIGCMSQGNIEFVKQHNPTVDSKKLHLLPNWRPLHKYPNHSRHEQIIDELGVKGKFIVIFGGNIGKPQKMINIVKLAKACEDLPDVVFLVFGKGGEKWRLEKDILEHRVTNLILYDSLPGPKYFDILHIADVGLISLSEDFTIPNIPSKALVYFNAKKPILAAIDSNTDLGKMLEDIGCGMWAEANDTEKLKSLLITLYQNPALREEMGEKGYEHLVKELTPEIAYHTVMRAIKY